MITLVICITVLGAVYLYFKYQYGFWDRKNVPNTPAEFLFGNLGDAYRMKSNVPYVFYKLYNEYKHAGLVGYFKNLTPAILIRSPELINKVMAMDFEHFQSNDFDVGKHDYISYGNPFFQEGAHWKFARRQVTPAFTSGKLKNMVPLTLKSAENLCNYIRDNFNSLNEKGFEGKDVFTRYTTDNTASCAFGLEANSFDEDKAMFYEMTRKIFPPSFITAMRIIVFLMFPTIARIFNTHFIPIKVSSYFENIITETIEYRKKENITRNDFIDLMTQLRVKYSEKEFGLIGVVAQSIQVFFNGAETSSSTIAFVMYNLSKNFDIQKRLQDEIDSVTAKYDDQITYDGIQEMNYLDQVLNESMRKHPVLFALSKRCTKTYSFPATANSDELTISAGTPISIPVYGLHMDAKYFPNPEVFDPERFSDENKTNIVKFTYLPFGGGPRACLGQRFGVLQAKIGIASVLKDFDVRLNGNTIEPILPDPTQFVNVPRNVYFNFYKRK